MCRSIKTLFIRTSVRKKRFVRRRCNRKKGTGFNKPSKVNEAAFLGAVGGRRLSAASF